MVASRQWFRFSLALCTAVSLLAAGSLSRPVCAAEPQASPPAVGELANDFELEAVLGGHKGKVKLSEVLKSGPVVLVVLRGFPGYQCPICSRQVGSFIARAKDFASAKANVLLVYPGPKKELSQRAQQFLNGTTLPAQFTLLLDPDYKFTDAYGLRWNAPRETAYPSTFIIGSDGKVRYAKISKSHGGRAKVGEVLKALE